MNEQRDYRPLAYLGIACLLWYSLGWSTNYFYAWLIAPLYFFVVGLTALQLQKEEAKE